MDSNVRFSYWCYNCGKFVREFVGVCLECESEFIEEIEAPSLSTHTESMNINTNYSFRLRKHKNNPRSFNTAIIIRGGDGVNGGERGSDYELYYDEGSGLLLPCSPAVQDSLRDVGYVLTRLAQTQTDGPCQRASKAVVESVPVIEISDCHVSNELHCAVCNEVFELGSEAREMPCKHIYHTDCILSWLSLKNSCPVCRHELPTDMDGGLNMPGAPRIILLELVIINGEYDRSSSAIRKFFRNIFPFFRRNSTPSPTYSSRYWELVDSCGLHWKRLL
ncbi:hypothetical protein MKW92_008612 [Papaver armeniacum]|nr:hypothetical protein MKW92_008612 [Papaver armeniacum]